MSEIRGEQLKYIIVQEATSDPVSPQPNQVWMLKTDYTGQPIGLLLALTYTGRTPTYQMSYQTTEGHVIRQNLS